MRAQREDRGRLTVFECQHPSAPTDHDEVYRAVALAEELYRSASSLQAEQEADVALEEAEKMGAGSDRDDEG